MFALSIFVYLRGPKAKVNWTFALYSLSIAIWSGCETYAIIAPTKELGLFWWRINHAGVIFIPVFFFHFVVSLLQEEKKYKKVLLIYYVLGFIFLFLDATPLLIADVTPKFSFKNMVVPGKFYYLFFGSWLAGIFIGLVKLFSAYFKSSGIKRNQLKYLCWTSLIGYIGGPFNFLPAFNIQIYPIMPFGTYGVPLYGIIIAYAIIKFRLMDVRIAAVRASIISLISVFMIALSITFGSLTKPLLTKYMSGNWWFVLVVFSMVLAIGGYYLIIYLIKKSEQIQRQRLHEAQESLETNSRGLIEIDKVGRLSKIIPRYLTWFYQTRLGFKIMHATIFLLNETNNYYVLESSAGEERQLKGKALLKDNPLCIWFTKIRKLILDNRIIEQRDIDVLRIDDIDYWQSNPKITKAGNELLGLLENIKKQMHELKAVICVPSFFKGELLGFLLLGNKSQGIYTEDELDLFTRLATNAGAAFVGAKLSEKLREAEVLAATGDLLTSVRHEILNILSRACGDLQVIPFGSYDNDLDKIKKISSEAAANILSVKKIFNYVSEYRNKSLSDKLTEYSLNELIDSGAEHCKELIQERRITIYRTIDPRTKIKGGETLTDLLKHTMMNSCCSFKMEQGGGQISFSTKTDKDNNTIEIIQSDTGDDLTQQINDHKTMGGELFAERGKLGGINLFIARRIIKDHNGTLDIESNESKGTRFIIRLPLEFKV